MCCKAGKYAIILKVTAVLQEFKLSFHLSQGCKLYLFVKYICLMSHFHLYPAVNMLCNTMSLSRDKVSTRILFPHFPNKAKQLQPYL